MRHGDRLDNFEPLWKTTAARPWDPPLMEGGRVRAFRTGQKLRSGLGFPIHRSYDDPNANAGDTVPFDPSKLKVSVEYGLCEIMNRGAIHLDVAPKDGNWGFDISELEAMLPSGTVDDKVERVYKELPKWEETLPCTRSRYAQIFKVLADKYPTDNLLLLAHGEAVNVAVSEFKKDVNIYQVSYCAYAELKRPIFKKNQSFAAGDFTVLTNSGQTGVTYFPTSALTDNVSHSSI
ncbi:Phosphoglycerate mutase family protein [Quillaja saponaria]|nr:Phosphoglycerate mutase family protein [Quillaja saponaria]